MPKLKQPVSLQQMSLSALLEFVINFCDQLSVKGSFDELRQGISIIKQHICNHVPWYLLADFSIRFLHEFYAKERPVSHQKAATEILMDIEIVGLQCKGQILAYLDPKDVHRVRRLQELDLKKFQATISLDKFHLDDLTTFVFSYECTDLDLAIIGRNCSKLEVLKVPGSKISNKGLHALSLCSELRVVDILDCPVSYSGINSLLSVHKKIEEFAHFDGTGKSSGCDVLSHLDSSVCPSINRFVFDNDRDYKPVSLRAIVAKFPNLIHITMNLAITEDLDTLKYLHKLAGIEIKFCYDMYDYEVEKTWESLKALLSFIGKNITHLKVSYWDARYSWFQDTVDFIFRSCPNIENLKFEQGGGLVVIPSFPKLKQLVLRIPINFDQIEILDDPALEFKNLPSLETLSLLNYEMNFQAIESIMLDDNKFPNLSVIQIECLKPEDLEQLKLAAKTRNLDFKIDNDSESDSYSEFDDDLEFDDDIEENFIIENITIIDDLE